MFIGPTVLLQTIDGDELIVPSDKILYSSPYKDKYTKESAHVNHFIKLLNQQHKELASSLIGPGGDPPDFEIKRNNLKIGLELTEFTDPKRRAASKCFSKISDGILKLYNAGRLRGLSGLEFEINFNNEDNIPFNVHDKDISKLASQLESISKKINRNIPLDFVDNIESDICFPSGNVCSIGWRVSSISQIPVRGSKLANRSGFDINYCYSRTYTYEMIQNILSYLIIKKDKNNTTDELLISAGAPDQNGFQFCADAILIQQAVNENKISCPKTNNIKRIFLDLWGLEKVYKIL